MSGSFCLIWYLAMSKHFIPHGFYDEAPQWNLNTQVLFNLPAAIILSHFQIVKAAVSRGQNFVEICKNFRLTVAQRCSHAETNSQTGSDISWAHRGGFKGVKSGLQFSSTYCTCRIYPGSWKGYRGEVRWRILHDGPAGWPTFLLPAALAGSHTHSSRSGRRGHFCKLFHATAAPAKAAAAHSLTWE